MGTSLTNTSRYLVKMSPKIRKVPSYGTLKKNDKGTPSMMVSRHDMKLSSLGIWADGHGYPGWCRCHAASIPSLTCPPWFRWKGSWKDGFLSPPDKFSWFHLQILVDTGWQRYKMYIFICILYVYNMSTAYIYIYVFVMWFPNKFCCCAPEQGLEASQNLSCNQQGLLVVSKTESYTSRNDGWSFFVLYLDESYWWTIVWVIPSGYVWLFNIAMENGPVIDGLPGFTYKKKGDFPWLC